MIENGKYYDIVGVTLVDVIRMDTWPISLRVPFESFWKCLCRRDVGLLVETWTLILPWLRQTLVDNNNDLCHFIVEVINYNV